MRRQRDPFAAVMARLSQVAEEPRLRDRRPATLAVQVLDVASMLQLQTTVSAGKVDLQPMDRVYDLPSSAETIQPVSMLDQVASELVLKSELTRADLRRLRRAYARVNHPDRVASLDREEATQRMMIANALIDRALAVARDCC